MWHSAVATLPDISVHARLQLSPCLPHNKAVCVLRGEDELHSVSQKSWVLESSPLAVASGTVSPVMDVILVIVRTDEGGAQH
jgi:hypothetical protein